MKAISIKQPWASLIVHGIKPIENRTWKCPEKYIGKRVLVHASIKSANFWDYPKEIRSIVDNFLTKISKSGTDWSNYPNGAIIGSAVIKDCVVNHPSIWAEKTPLYNDFCKGCHCPNYIEWDYMGKHISCKKQGESDNIESLAYGCKFKKQAPKPIYNWVLESPTLYEEPIPAKGNLSFWEYEEIKEVKIECPECGMIQPALIDRSGPWDSFVHECRNCSYMITESDWEEE